jgi:hypothetical protein
MAKKKQPKIINYVRNGVVVRSEIAPKRQTTKWTTEEIDFLKNNFQHMTARALSEQLGRSWESTRGQLKRFKLTVGEKLRRERQAGRKGMTVVREGTAVWTEEAIEYLKANYNVESISKIATTLDIKYNSVYKKLHRLGLKVDEEFTKQIRQNVISDVNSRRRAYYSSEEYIELQKKKQQSKRTKVLKARLLKRDLKDVEKMKRFIKKTQERIDKNDATINHLAKQKQDLRAEMKRTESKMKTLTDKLSILLNNEDVD